MNHGGGWGAGHTGDMAMAQAEAAEVQTGRGFKVGMTAMPDSGGRQVGVMVLNIVGFFRVVVVNMEAWLAKKTRPRLPELRSVS